MHEMESMMYVGDTPWHGLGVKLDHSPTPDEALVCSGLNWYVNEEPLFLRAKALGQKAQLVECSKAIVRDVDRKVLGVVGKTYTPLQNIEAFAWVAPLVEGRLISLEVAGSLRGGKIVWILAKVVGGEADIRKNDPVKQFVLLAHSHDGTMSVRSGFTAIRVVCMNTLNMSLSSDNLHKVKHTYTMKERLGLVREKMEKHIHEFKNRVFIARKMAATPMPDIVKVRLYASKVFDIEPIPQLEPALHKKTAELMVIANQGRGNTGSSVWDLYNGVTEYLNYRHGRSQETRLDSLWFGAAANTNAKAWEEAVKLAA